MSLSRCTRCGTSCAPDLGACPQCEGTEFADPNTPLAWTCQNDDCRAQWKLRLLQCPRCHGSEMRLEEVMPRITVAGGPSNADAQPGEVGYIAPPEETGAATPPEETPETAPPVAETQTPPPRPPASAPKTAWVEHVVAAGADPAEAQAMTKPQLQAWTPPAPSQTE